MFSCIEDKAAGTATVILPDLKFGGRSATPFPHAAPVNLVPGPTGKDGNASFTGTATVPAAVFAQLASRAKAYPVPWDIRDDDASWLQPQRLLLFLQLNCTTGRAGACDDKMFASLELDGTPLPALRSYESRCVECKFLLRHGVYHWQFVVIGCVGSAALCMYLVVSLSVCPVSLYRVCACAYLQFAHLCCLPRHKRQPPVSAAF